MQKGEPVVRMESQINTDFWMGKLLESATWKIKKELEK
jgi:hypothetical protein